MIKHMSLLGFLMGALFWISACADIDDAYEAGMSNANALNSEALAPTDAYPLAKVSYSDFNTLVKAVEPHRAKRLIDLNTFLKMSEEENTIIFDSRSDSRFDRIRVKGSHHLSFTDFTQDNLAKVIPSFNTRILIYCNNNFEGNPIDFTSKVARPPTLDATETKDSLMMALNVPTYVNLYGYGYRNVYELNELVDVNDARIAFEGSTVNK